MEGSGLMGLPGLVDCHTHLVWAGSRASEFAERLRGKSYTEILQAGGGILSTVEATRTATHEELVVLAVKRLERMASKGVTTVEIKSGYGLSPQAELKQLQVAKEAGKRVSLDVFTTFLGAHAIPADFREDREGYVQQIIDEQLPLVAPHADFIDAYVDRGAFSVDEGRRILQAGVKHGLKPRIHAEQVAYTGAAAMPAELGALSADHLERIDDAGVAAMARAGTVAVLLPGAMLYLKDDPPPVAKLRAAGVPMAVATDFNPGSSPVDDLWICGSLACLSMGLSVEEALLGVTRNAALALGQTDRGHLAEGALGDLILVRPRAGEKPTMGALLQYLGAPDVHSVIKSGAPLPA